SAVRPTACRPCGRSGGSGPKRPHTAAIVSRNGNSGGQPAMSGLRNLLNGLHFEGVSPSWWWLWPLLVVGGAFFLFWPYPGIFQRSEPRLTWWLLALRGLGLLLLVLILSKPVWTRESEEVDPGHVAIVVDNSRSMSLPDSSGATRYALA